MDSTRDREDGGADAAMARVLAAEREAREAVETFVQEAGRRRDDARELEKRIAERAARRAASARAALAARLEQRLAGIAASERAIDASAGPDADERRRLAEALERLAEELVGSEP